MNGPRRELGWVHATAIVIGAIIGVGIFLTPSKVAYEAGSAEAALGLWALGGVIALCGALALAEVGARFPTSGGQLVALRAMLGPLPAFLYGWSLLVAIQTGVLALITLFAASNLAAALGLDWNDWTKSLVACAMLISLALANLAGARHGALVQTSTSFFKLLILAFLALLGLSVWLGAGPEALPEPVPAAEAAAPAGRGWWLAGMAAVLFSYGGFHQLTWVGGEVRRPERTVPWSILVGVLVVVAAYLAANAAYAALLPYDRIVGSDTLAADAIGRVFPGWGRRLTAVALCVSAYGIANASLLTAPRVYYALARERLFFSALGRLDPATGVPRVAILLQSALALGVLVTSSLQLGTSGAGTPFRLADLMDQLVNGIVFVDWSFHVLTCAGLLMLRRRAGAEHEGYRAPLGALVPGVFMLGSVVALGATFADASVRRSSLLGVAVIGAGLLVYALFARGRRNRNR